MILTAMIAAGYALYLPIGAYTATLTPLEPDLAIDHAIPLVPGFMFVYSLLYLTACLPLAVPTGRRLFRRIAAAYLFAELISYTAFVLLPVRMTIRPEAPPVDSLATWGLALIYWVDEPSNCLPSLHVSAALLAGLCAWSADRFVGTIGTVVALAIAASTLFVKQHWFADAVTGTALAFALWWWLVRGVEPDSSTRDRRGALILIGGQIALLCVAGFLYSWGWVPWE